MRSPTCLAAGRRAAEFWYQVWGESLDALLAYVEDMKASWESLNKGTATKASLTCDAACSVH